MFLRVSVWQADLDLSVEYDLAWVQWMENLGTSQTDPRVYTDPEFPAALTPYFPRIYLPEYKLGAAYDVILTKYIIGPAPASDDISQCQSLPTAVIRKGKGTKSKKVKLQIRISVLCCAGREGGREGGREPEGGFAYCYHTVCLQIDFSSIARPSIPAHHLCRVRGCTRPNCSRLHPAQYAGAKAGVTVLRAVNLLLVFMSRGLWNPPDWV